ncbi:hypothetical protein K437DRAFT_179760 [Tilletiaria anomala UBC 951]|uniref:Uncharacterized protein n=1 Tax=Tilletiaria anomala (strain ATCC 24038 / CBS 436.72 / UBC 951) TaxID=1037660 RepID=A0A066VHC6_TILAU|nr:uncharacterized protein K437DRAFT_179760 [Tilletiaria anomala UBC 951]KDN41142.1 hypothetical protein K437DRAFT_179760 [Tilletiaria anomala UBC 951]
MEGNNEDTWLDNLISDGLRQQELQLQQPHDSPVTAFVNPAMGDQAFPDTFDMRSNSTKTTFPNSSVSSQTWQAPTTNPSSSELPTSFAFDFSMLMTAPQPPVMTTPPTNSATTQFSDAKKDYDALMSFLFDPTDAQDMMDLMLASQALDDFSPESNESIPITSYSGQQPVLKYNGDFQSQPQLQQSWAPLSAPAPQTTPLWDAQSQQAHMFPTQKPLAPAMPDNSSVTGATVLFGHSAYMSFDVNGKGTVTSGAAGEQASRAGGSSPKRKAQALEQESSLAGSRTVPDQVYEERLAERRGITGRIAGKSVVEVSIKCGEPTCNNIDKIVILANALFHHSDSPKQVSEDYRITAKCRPCQLMDKPSPGASFSPSREAGITKPGWGRRVFQKCDVCEQALGEVIIEAVVSSPEGSTDSSSSAPSGASSGGLDEKQRIPVEAICAACDVAFAWCTQCGGGGAYRTGKWRPKQLFPPGRKTCRLRTIRLSGTPSVEIFDIGVPNEPVPRDVIDGCQEVFETKFLFRYAKPQYLRHNITFEKLVQLMGDYWSWIEQRLMATADTLPDDMRRVMGIMRGPFTVAGKGKVATSGVLSYQVMEWKPLDRTICLVGSGIALTGLSSARWMLLHGRSITYRIFLLCHEPPDQHPDDASYIEPSVPEPLVQHPTRLYRLELISNPERRRYFLTNGWRESGRTKFDEASASSAKAWLRYDQATRLQLDMGLASSFPQQVPDGSLYTGGRNQNDLVELEFPFDYGTGVPDAIATMVRVSKAKTIMRPLRGDEQSNHPNYPCVKIGPQEA